MKKIVKCIRKDNRIEISDTIASKSSICKRYGAKWNPTTQSWTWEPSTLYPSFDVDAFLNDYASGPAQRINPSGLYNAGSNAAYWAFRKKLDLLKAQIEIEKEKWSRGIVPIDERSSDVDKRAGAMPARSNIGAKAARIICPTPRDDAYVYAYGSMPCSCKTCQVNDTAIHNVFDASKWDTVGYIIGTKAAVEELSRPKMNYNRFSWHTQPLVDLEDGRAVVLFHIFDTNYD